MRYKIVVSYDGGAFNGWQKQPHGPPTVQGTLEAILKRLLQTPTHVMGSGRTDTGVHAVAQVAHFDSDRPVDATTFRGLNGLSPEGLVIRSLWQAPSDFHALASASSKTYIYRIWNASQPSVFRRHWTHWVNQPLDLEKLNALSTFLVGELDFKSFQSRGTPVKSTMRNVTEAHWRRMSPHLLEFRITGTGFLKQMVRNIVGTLLYLERKNLSTPELKAILEATDRQAAKDTAPPQGLYLLRVKYPEAIDSQCRRISP